MPFFILSRALGDRCLRALWDKKEAHAEVGMQPVPGEPVECQDYHSDWASRFQQLPAQPPCMVLVACG